MIRNVKIADISELSSIYKQLYDDCKTKINESVNLV